MLCDSNDRLTNVKPMADVKEKMAGSDYVDEEKKRTKTHPLADLKAGDYLKNGGGYYRRVLSDVQHPELGELATVLTSFYDHDKNHDDLKKLWGWATIFQLAEEGWEKETPRTIDDVLATLSEEDRKIVESTIKKINDTVERIRAKV